MSNTRQTILFRKDFVFPVGLLAAQVAHLHMEFFRKLMLDMHHTDTLYKFSPDLLSWLETPYTFVHVVPNLVVLEHFMRKAKAAGVPFVEWRDTVYINISDTQREAFPDVLIGIAFQPTESDKIKAIIGDLPLL